MTRLFTNFERESIERAIACEIESAKRQVQQLWLDIDAIEPLGQTTQGYAYRILLSKPIHLSAEQPLIFHLKGGISIDAFVLNCTDEGIEVVCKQPLPPDAVVMNVTFDPTFILQQLKEFLFAKDSGDICGPLATRVVQKQLKAAKLIEIATRSNNLNEDQRRAIAAMHSQPVHLLWGPPGTGKTKTLGAAIAKWMELGKRVLIVSTSNAAVDVAMKAVLMEVKGRLPLARMLYRLGTSIDPEIIKYSGNSDPSAYRVICCTLAKMVLEPSFRTTLFDVVAVDEASMVSLLYAFAASAIAQNHLVYAGDPKQLPPICQSENSEAQEWLGRNIYDWLGIDSPVENDDSKPMVFLRTQYRMTNQIGGLVSRLTYRGKLLHGRREDGVPAEFINLPMQWCKTYYSVSEKSYYHPFAVPLIHEIVRLLNPLQQRDILLLTPFRPQQSLMSALAFDLRKRFLKAKISSSTIHRSQGSERRTVIVDLTTHSPDKLAPFFKDKKSDRLLNVALSRSKDYLIVIGNEQLIKTLAIGDTFWRRLIGEWNTGLHVYPAEEILDETYPVNKLQQILGYEPDTSIPAICSCGSERESLPLIASLFDAIKSPRKLMVMGQKQPVSGNFIIREDALCPPLFTGQGYLCLPLGSEWLAVRSPNVSRVLWRIGFSHLAEEEVKPTTKLFQCPKCTPGHLILRQESQQWRLVCSNEMFKCFYSRPASLEDIKKKIRLSGDTCEFGHPLTARSSVNGIFMGCENYPDCKQAKSLKLIEGM